MLEIVDGAFDEIAREVDDYTAAIANKTPTQLSDTEINSLSLQRYSREIAEQYGIQLESTEIPDDVLAELKAFGLNKIGDLRRIADDETLRLMKEYIEDENMIGFVRTLMMYSDIDRYFSIWNSWSGLDSPTALLLARKYGRNRVQDILSEHEVSIVGGED
jgi:hypothetical protein